LIHITPVRPLRSSSSSWPGLLPDCHSFPTRRSSDLSSGHRLISFDCFRPHATSSLAVGRDGGRTMRTIIAISSLALLGACAKARSEEHTSELQSRENLVCRLLLEKKKKRTAMIQLYR